MKRKEGRKANLPPPHFHLPIDRYLEGAFSIILGIVGYTFDSNMGSKDVVCYLLAGFIQIRHSPFSFLSGELLLDISSDEYYTIVLDK